MSLDTKAKLHAAIDSKQTSTFQDAIDTAKSTAPDTTDEIAKQVAMDKGGRTGFQTWLANLTDTQKTALTAASVGFIAATVGLIIVLIYFLYDPTLPPSPSPGTSLGTPSPGTVLCNTYITQNTCNDAFNQLDPTNKCVWSLSGTECLDAWMITQDGTPIIDAPFDGFALTNNRLYDSYRQESAPSNILVEAIRYEDSNGYSTPIISVTSANTILGQQAADRRRFASKWTQYSIGGGGTGQVLTINIFMNDDGSFNPNEPNRTYNQTPTLLTPTSIKFYIVGSNTLLYGDRDPSALYKIDILPDNSLVYSSNRFGGWSVELQNSNNSIKPVEQPGVDIIKTKFITRL